MSDVRRIVNEHPKSNIGHRERAVLVLVGPTGAGKTPLSLLIATQLGAEILSADSRQIYKLLDIGTAKVTRHEMNNTRHFFVDELMPDEEFSAAEFGRRGRAIIDDLIRRNKVPLVVGGSGLYVEALIDGLFEGPAADNLVREKLEARLLTEGGAVLLEELRSFDPEAAANMLSSQTRRIIRAHEVFLLTGIPISNLQKTIVEINFTPVLAGVRWNRTLLYRRINERVDRMFEHGFVEEVRKLKQAGYSSQHKALNTVGYKEVFDHLDGKIPYERSVELVKQNSRRYAKRQMTWFRADKRIRWFDVSREEDFPDLARQICDCYLNFCLSG